MTCLSYALRAVSNVGREKGNGAVNFQHILASTCILVLLDEAKVLFDGTSLWISFPLDETNF